MENKAIPNFKQTNENENAIKKSRGAYSGSEEAIKFLIKSDKETQKSFDLRKQTLIMGTGYKDGIDKIVAIIFRKPLTFSDDMHPKLLEWYKTADGTNTLNEFAKKALSELLTTNRAYIQVWTDKENPDRPYLKLLQRERIPYIYRDGHILTQIAVKGSRLVMKDKYTRESKDEHKIYFSDGTVEVWVDDKMDDIIETKYGQVPIIETVLTGDEYDFKKDLPPFLDLAKSQIAHLDTMSDKRAYLKRLGYPILYTWGLGLGDVESDEDGYAKVNISYEYGYNFAITEDGKPMGGINLIEYSGANDEVLNKELTRLEEAISDGFISFVSDDGGNKTVTQSESERVSGESILSSISKRVEDMLNKTNLLFAQIAGIEESDIIGKLGYITVNNDFLNTKLTKEQAEMLFTLNELDKISDRTLLELLKEGGELKGVDIDEEIKVMEALGR